jgi:hypothetical protein
MRPYFIIFLACAALLYGGCSSPTSSREFADSLSLGTGRYGIDLTGTATAFQGPPDKDGNPLATIYWRVESKEKLRGADVQFMVQKSNGIYWDDVYQTIYEMTDQDDYVVIGSYYHQYGAGEFRATGYIPRDEKSFGPIEFTVSVSASRPVSVR